MGPWEDDEPGDDVAVGKRRRRAKRRRVERVRSPKVVIPVTLVLVAALVAGAYWWFTRPTGLAALPNPAVVAPGGFRASIGDDHRTITVGLEVRNVADTAITVTSARILAPTGLTATAISILSPGPENEGFSFKGELPPIAPVRLGTGEAERNAIVAARFTVSCPAVLASAAPTDEQIFITIQIGQEQREEEVTPPVVGDLPWLTATAQRACTDPVVDPTEQPLPGDSPTPAAGG